MKTKNDNLWAHAGTGAVDTKENWIIECVDEAAYLDITPEQRFNDLVDNGILITQDPASKI